MASFEFLAIILTGLGLTVSLVYYTSVLSNQNKTIQTQLFLQLNGTATEENIQTVRELMKWNWENYDDFTEKYDSDDALAAKYRAQFQRFNGLGLLAMRKQIDINLIYDFANGPIVGLWWKFGDIIKKQRELSGWSRYEGLEFLYNEMKKREQINR